MQALQPRLVLLMVLFGLASPVVHSQPTPPEFGIREDRPRTGSFIRRDAITSNKVPVNRKYHELTDEEKAAVHAHYERIEPGDEPPFPAEGLRPIYDALRRAQEKLRVKGTLRLLVDVGADGEPIEVSALSSPSEDMTTFASSVLLITKYKPAMCSGNPCRMQFPLYMDFTLKR